MWHKHSIPITFVPSLLHTLPWITISRTVRYLIVYYINVYHVIKRNGANIYQHLNKVCIQLYYNAGNCLLVIPL